MKLLIFALWAMVVACGDSALAGVWQPIAGHTQIPIWHGAAPDSRPVPAPESVVTTSHLVAGRHYMAVLNVSRPTMTVYAPRAKNNGAAVVVLPGGGFAALAIDLEGTEACD
ncbi:MAG TPA: hypothetical protein VGK90_07305, partial [Rhizomicrobium sp.]